MAYNLLDGYEEWEKTGKVATGNTTTAQPKQNTYNLLDGYEDWAKENVPKKKPPEPTFAEKAGQAINNAVDYAQKTALPAAQNALNNLGDNINNTVNNWGKDFDNTVNNFGNNLYNGISQIGNITYNPQQNLITGGGVTMNQPAPDLQVNKNILNNTMLNLAKNNPQPQPTIQDTNKVITRTYPSTSTPIIPQYQPKQTGVLNPAVNAVGDVISEIGDSTFRTGARLLDNIYENSKKTRINPLTGEKSTVNDINMWTIAKGIRDTLDPAKAAYADQNPAYFENKYFGSKENRGMLKALERGEIKPYTDEDFNYLQTNAVKNIDLKKNELQKLLDSGQISAQKADELYKGYINEVREQTKAQRVGMLEHNFRLQNEAEANFARVEQNSELANKAFATYILAQTAGTVAPLELGGQKIGQAVTQAATKAAKEKLYKKLFYEEGLKAGLDKAVIDNAYKQVGKDFFLKNYAEKGFEEFGLTGAKKTAAEMGQNLLKGTIGAGTDMGVIGAASNAAANNTTLVDTGVNPVEAFIEGAKEGAPYGAMSLIPYAGLGMAKALQNIKIKGKMKPYQTGTAVDIYKENPYVKYGYENGKGFYTYEDRTKGRTNFTEKDPYNRSGKKWEQIPQNIEDIAPKTAAKQAENVETQATQEQTQSAQTGEMVKTPEQNQIADSSKMVENKDIDVETLAKERAELLNQDSIKQHRKYIESERKKGREQNADNLEKQLEEYIASGKNQYEGQHNIDFANAIKNKDYNKLLPILAQGKGQNETSKKLFTKYTGVKLPSTIEGKKNAILEWAGKDVEEYNKEVKAAYDKKQAEREQKYKNQELESIIKDLQSEKVSLNNGKVITRKEFIDNIVKSGEYNFENKKQGIKPVYYFWNKNNKLGGYKFDKRADRIYIDSLLENKDNNIVNEEVQVPETEGLKEVTPEQNSAPQEKPKEQPKSKVEQLAPNIAEKQSEKLSKEEAINKTNKTLEENSKNSKLPKYTYTKDVSFNKIVTDGKYVSNGDFAMLADEIRMVKNPKTQVDYVEIEKLIPTVETKPFAEGVEFYTNNKKKPTQFVALETQDGDKRYINKKYYDLVKNGATLEYIEGKRNFPLVVKKDGKTIGVIMPVEMRDTSDLTKIESQAPAKTETKEPEPSKIEKIAPNISKKQMIQEKVDKAAKTLSDNQFVPDSQKQAMLANMKGEEKEHFADLVNELQERIDHAPALYQTDGVDREKIKPVLHYFGGNFDLYVTEIDKETGEMYGLGGFNGDYEFGYNSMENLKGLGDRLNVDLYPDKNLTVKDLLKEEVEKDENIGYNDNKETNYGHNESTVLQQPRVAEEKQGINEKSDRVAGNEPETSTSISRIGRSDNNSQSASGRRLTPEHEGIINKSYKNQHELNKAIEEFVNNKEYEKYDTLPDEVKDFLKKYSGAGGLEKQGAEGKGLLSEYYTPKNIVQKMWELTSQYINTDGAKVLEPSVGIGRFLEYAPENTKFDVVEMNPVSAKITELLYPNANVEVGQFQKRFINPVNNTPVKKVTPEYDIVIGNPPYGEYSGKYKGLGEGKGIPSNELYFIKRGLDTLKDNGVMTFIVPSSFLNNSINKTKMEISANAEILDAYRLPEKTFDTTSIGTDIIVLRKTSEPHDRQVFNAGKWFEEHPEKILGEVGERKNRFGKMENFVKGDKNAVEKIDTSAKNIKETAKTIEPKTTTTKTTPTQKATITKTQKAKKETKPFVQNNDYERYVPAKKATEAEAKLWNDTSVDGSLRGDYKAGKDINQYEGKLYNDFNYLQGNIYEKLDTLEKEDISPEQKRIQKEKLLKVLPEPKTISQIDLSPTSGFIKNYPLTKEVKGANGTSDTVTTYLDRMYLDWVQDLTNKERNGISVWDIRDFVNGKVVRTPYKGNPTKEEKENQRAEFLTKLKNTVDKTFNDFINTTLTAEELDKLQDTWNRNMNSDYVPDYKDMPLMVKDLNSKFYGDKLTLQDVQIEGINYLTNKGVGLLGFEVGVGKTLSGIISTVQNMQMGRCKRPLILVPKSVKPNWIREIHEAFPNIKVNDVDNLSKFKGEIEDGTLTVGTYQALDNIWYNASTVEDFITQTGNIREDKTKKVNKFGDLVDRNKTKRGKEKEKDKNEEFVLAALKGNKKLHTFEDLGFDHITVDEAHNFKNLFGDAKADDKDGNPYTKIKGAESTRAKRLFLASQYVLNNNNNRNIFMLTATPFNNSPLEVFNMLSYLAKDKLDKMGINNVYQFMENYVDLDADWVVDSKNEVSFKQIAKGFKNLGSLQNVIDSVMLMRSAEDAGIKRPNKVTKHFALNPTDKQKKIIAKTEALAVGIDVDDEGNIRFLDKEEKKSAQLKALTQGRIAALSPDIYEGNLEVSPEDFIKNSPKLDFIMQAVEKMQKQDPSTSQLIYMPIGVDFLPKMKEYLVNKGVYKPNEIEIIQGGISDDKISAVSDSFNDPNGDVKLIIGTNKIKEGMNLNKNSSVLYVPFIDWNPTDYVQVVGRIWRRGNKYKNIRIVVPTLNDSSDSFMYQKLDEKTSRINNIMSRGVDYIDTGELNAAEEKINMITDPEKKAKMFTQIEQQKLESRKNELEGTLQDSKYYQSELQSAKNNIDYYGKQVERLTKELSEIEDKESWQYSNKKTYLESYKKELKNAERHLENLENKIKRLELDFEGKDSVENIQKRIEDVKKQIENIKETTQIKLEEYKKEYIKNRVEGKKIEDYIKEFDEDTTNGGFLEYGDYAELPEFIKTHPNLTSTKRDIDNLDVINEKIYEGILGKDLKKLLPTDIAQELGTYVDKYLFKNLKNPKIENTLGIHKGALELIKINLAAVGKNPSNFITVLMHEIRHAIQKKIYLGIVTKLAKGQKLTNEELDFKKKYERSNKKLKIIRRYRSNSKVRKIVQDFDEKTAGMDRQEKENYLETLPNEKQKIIIKDRKYYNAYRNLFKEIDAQEFGEIFGKEFANVEKDVGQGVQKSSRNNDRGIFRIGKSISRGLRKRNSGTNNRGMLLPRSTKQTQDEYGDFSEGVTNTEPKKNVEITPEQAKKSDKQAKDNVRNWYAEIEKGRYDVNKTLTSLINLTNQKAKSFNVGATGKQLRELMPFLRERTDFPDKLNRPDLKKVWNKLSDSQKGELRKLADSVSEKFEKYYKEYQETKGVVTESEIENHISHIWDLDKKQKSLLTNYYATKSRFANERTIDTLFKGIQGIKLENGETQYFTPKTLDYAEILKTSSDTFIKSIADIKLANTVKEMKVGKTKLVQQMKNAPSDWVEINHPALNKAVYMGEVGENDTPMLMKMPVKVHPEIANTLLTVFETPATHNDFLEGFDKLNSVQKQFQLGFSGFHMVALSEAALGNMGIKGVLKVLNPVRAWNEIKNGNWSVYKEDTIAKQAIDDGLQLGATLDLDRKTVEKIADDVAESIDKKVPFFGKALSGIFKGASKLQKFNNILLWDYLHNNFKLECYKMKCAEYGKNKTLSTDERREIAQWVNDSFGGQVWENLGIKPSGRRTEQRILLSPDWLRSTTRQFLGMFSSKKTANLFTKMGDKGGFWKKAKELGERWGISSNTDDVTSSGLRGRMARAFWVRAIIYSAVLYNAMNAVFREKDRREHPELYPEKMTAKDYSLLGNSKGNRTYVFIGRNSDGTERYLRLGKQFREVPEMLENPIKKLGGKASPNVQLGSQLFTGHTASGFKNKEFFENKYPYTTMKTGTDRLVASAKTIGKSFLPYSTNDLFNPEKDYSAWSLIAPVAKGTTKGKGQNEFAKNIYDKKNVKEVAESLKRNGYSEKDIKKTYKSARSEVRRQYRDEFVKAIESGDKKKVKEVAYRLRDKKGLSEAEITLIYKKAIKKVKEKE